MQIKNARSALISNYEVLKLLQENQEAQIQAQRLDPLIEYPEQLRTVQFEVTSITAWFFRDLIIPFFFVVDRIP